MPKKDTNLELIAPEILAAFRNHPIEWQAEWREKSRQQTFYPERQAKMDVISECIAALYWWGHYGAYIEAEQ